MDRSFLKSRYDFELDQRDKLTASIALPSGIATALGSLMAAMVRSFSYHSGGLTVAFVVFLVVDVAALVVSLAFLAKAYHGLDYELLPSLGALSEAEAEWQAFAESTHSDPGEMQRAFEAELDTHIIKATDRNARSNLERYAYRHRANLALFGTMSLTLALAVPFVIDQAKMKLQ